MAFSRNASLPSWWDFVRECFYFGTEAQPRSQGRVEFPSAEIRGVFKLCVHHFTRISDWLRVLKRQSNVNRYL